MLGKKEVLVTNGKQPKHLPLYADGPSLLGIEWLQHIKSNWKQIAVISNTTNMTQLQLLLEKRPKLFEDTLGTMRDYKAVKLSTKPRFHHPRPVPFAIHEAIRKELDRLEQSGIIEMEDHVE